jgi:hypothetical protein
MSFAFPLTQQIKFARTTLELSTSSSVALSARDKLLDAILKNRKDELSILVQDLLSSQRHTYDPNESLLGQFFCSIVLPNQSPPLWKLLSFVPEQTIAGQQYFEDGEALRVVNYSELLGPSVHLRAEGTFQTNRTQNANKGPFPWLSFGQQFSPRKECPDDYTVTVTQVSLHLGSFVWKLPIQGSSVLRVLYGDSDLRIFVSPQDTESTVGDWERRGLIVVQVRNDLINPLRPLDLRAT